MAIDTSVKRVGAGVLLAAFTTGLFALAPATAAADSVRITSDGEPSITSTCDETNREHILCQ